MQGPRLETYPRPREIGHARNSPPPNFTLLFSEGGGGIITRSLGEGGEFRFQGGGGNVTGTEVGDLEEERGHGLFLKLPAILKLTNTYPFAAWFLVIGDATKVSFGLIFESPTFHQLENMDPFAAWFVVSGDATPDGIRRAVGSWSHWLPFHCGFSRMAVLRGQTEPSIRRSRVVTGGSSDSYHREVRGSSKL